MQARGIFALKLVASIAILSLGAFISMDAWETSRIVAIGYCLGFGGVAAVALFWGPSRLIETFLLVSALLVWSSRALQLFLEHKQWTALFPGPFFWLLVLMISAVRMYKQRSAEQAANRRLRLSYESRGLLRSFQKSWCGPITDNRKIESV